MDVAALGLSVDSSQVRAATADLDKLTNVAAKAEAVAASLGRGAGSRRNPSSRLPFKKWRREETAKMAAIKASKVFFERLKKELEKLK